MSVFLPVSHKYWAQIDLEDFEWAVGHAWCICNGYAVARIAGKNKSLHRLVMKAPKGSIVDHINRNPLDNRRSNLRFCTVTENKVNVGKAKNNTSGFKGVRLQPRNKFRPWCARIIVNKKEITLGAFSTPEEAAEAYRLGALKYHGIDHSDSIYEKA